MTATKRCPHCGKTFHKKIDDRQWSKKLFCDDACRKRHNDAIKRQPAERKKCNNCESVKYLWQFRIIKRNDDGRSDICKACESQRVKQARKEEALTETAPHLTPLLQIPLGKSYMPLIPTCGAYSECLKMFLDQ